MLKGGTESQQSINEQLHATHLFSIASFCMEAISIFTWYMRTASSLSQEEAAEPLQDLAGQDAALACSSGFGLLHPLCLPTVPPPAQCCLPSQDPQPTSHLNWCSRELRILEEKRSASFSRLREYSSSISAFLRKNSCKSCSSCSRDSDCCSRHLNCSTSCVRISVGSKELSIRLWLGTAVDPHPPRAQPEPQSRYAEIWQGPHLLYSLAYCFPDLSHSTLPSRSLTDAQATGYIVTPQD